MCSDVLSLFTNSYPGNSPAAGRVDPDMRYIWNFIAFSLNIVYKKAKKPNLPLPSGGQIFLRAILVMGDFANFGVP